MLDLGRRESIGWVDTEHWLSEQLNKGTIPVATAETILRPMAEGRGWDHQIQASVMLGFIDGLTADDPAVAERLRAHLAKTCGVDGGFRCRECGAEAFVSDAGTTHHWGLSPDGIDHARDRDHTALPEREP